MMRLTEPTLNFEQTFDECLEGITGNPDLKSRLENQKQNLLTAGNNYIASGNSGNLYSIQPIDTTASPNPFVVDKIRKSELVNLYDYYFLNEDKKSRLTYERLLNSAQEQCPFCGGIGTPRNLDHFLPKAHFPQFSILPQNLVPSCRDCNMDGKATAFATIASKQLIQPYVDHDRFFTTQWIFAKYITINPNVPGVLRYYVSPPVGWNNTDIDRINQHFSDFNLGKRYSVKAAQLLGTTNAQIARMRRRGTSNEVICSDLLDPGIEEAPFINHWQKGMYQALRDSLI